MRPQSAPQGAQATLRALRLLKLFSSDRPELPLASLCRLAGLNKTTAHRLLAALASESMVDRNPVTGDYRLGPGLMALGVQALSSNNLRLRVRPMLKSLAHDSGETATLEVPVEDSMLILDEVAGAHVVGASGNVGTRWPMHATSTGKVMLAFSEDGLARLGQNLPALTARTVVDRSAIERQCSEIRRRGYAETVDELELGFSAVAAVIRGPVGEALGTLSISGPTQRLTKVRRAQFGALLCAASENLGVY